MRLTEKEVKIIKESFAKFFQKEDSLWLFGSRVDDTKKGGDIDRHIVVCDLHSRRLKFSILKTKNYAPLTAKKFENLSDEEIAFFDMLAIRFTKLQDVIGSKIFPFILNFLNEDAESFLDKLNRLEKLNFISSKEWWITFRNVRNDVTHDYPDDYDNLSRHFNKMFELSSELISYWENLKQKLVEMKI